MAVVLSASVLFAILLLRMGGDHASVLLAERYEFRAPAFVQARVLVHLVARAAGEAVPSAGITTIYGVIAVLSTAAVLLSFRRLAAAASASRTLLTPLTFSTGGDWSFLLILVPMAWNYLVLSDVFMPEDLPAAALFALGLAFILEGRTAWFYTVFALGCLNRETIVLLAPAFALAAPLGGGRRGAMLRIAHTAALLLLWAGIRALVFALLPDRCGSVLYEDHLSWNLAFLRDMLLMKPHAAGMWLLFGGFWALLPFAWRRMPPVVRRLFVVFPLMGLAMLYAGNFSFEARIWSELVPLAALIPLFCLGDPPPSAQESSVQDRF